MLDLLCVSFFVFMLLAGDVNHTYNRNEMRVVFHLCLRYHQLTKGLIKSRIRQM